jgi:hypothetical protein
MYLEETAIYVMLASGPVKILTVYLLPSQPVIDLDLSACFSGGNPHSDGRGSQCQTLGLES